jgi:hypothetical protein
MHGTQYDVSITLLIVVSAIAAVWSGYAMSKHSREIRVYKQLRAEFPFNKWPNIMKPKSFPQWVTKLAAYFLPISKKGGQ